MLRLPDTPLPGNASRWLQKWQADVDALPHYAARVAEAKRAWVLKNVNANKTFGIVKETLTEMQGCLRRCAYCEDSCANQIEHIFPKTLYPDRAFVWDNYLYACGVCNPEKRDQFAVFPGTGNVWINVQRKKGDPDVEPVAGDAVLIDPRREDPLAFLFLDLKTFQSEPFDDDGTRSFARAKYTIQTLCLWREPLRLARENAAHGFVDRLEAYVGAKGIGDAIAELDRRRSSLLRSPHQTVWREMQRQNRTSPKLTALFAAVPEALHW